MRMVKSRWGPPAFALSLLAVILSLGGTSFASELTAAPQPAWHNLRLLNGWRQPAGGVYFPAYFIDSDHVVHLRGAVAGGTPGNFMFQLPRGVRPAHRVTEPVLIDNDEVATLLVFPNGDVGVLGLASQTSLQQAFTGLDGITFRVP